MDEKASKKRISRGEEFVKRVKSVPLSAIMDNLDRLDCVPFVEIPV